MLLVVFSNENMRGTVAVNFHVKENVCSIKIKFKKREKEVCPQILLVGATTLLPSAVAQPDP